MEIKEYNAPRLFTECVWKMRIVGKRENSRNGEVLRIPEPVILCMQEPTERMLFDDIRQANPFFHIMEFVWMMAGSRDLLWIQQFNKRYDQYADNGIVHGAYGYRWREGFGFDQIIGAITHLRKDPTSRRAVLSMWSPFHDLDQNFRDLPCNTHIYLEVADNKSLELTVCNRSNDLIWGALGANVVHMTMLQELMALELGYTPANYRVFTKNLHVYLNLPNHEKIMNMGESPDAYIHGGLRPYPLLHKGENIDQFLMDSERLVKGGDGFRTKWFRDVALPIHDYYLNRKEGKDSPSLIDQIRADDVRHACNLWRGWKNVQRDL